MPAVCRPQQEQQWRRQLQLRRCQPDPTVSMITLSHACCCLQAVPGLDVAALAVRVQALEGQQQHLQQSLQAQLAAMDSEMHHLHSSVGTGFERLQVVSAARGVQVPGAASSRGLPAPVAGTAAAAQQQGPAGRGLHSPAAGPAAVRQEQARPADPAQAAPPADEGQAVESDHSRGAQAWQPEVAAVAATVAELREAVEDLNGRLFELRVEVQNLEGDVGINIASIKLKVGPSTCAVNLPNGVHVGPQGRR